MGDYQPHLFYGFGPLFGSGNSTTWSGSGTSGRGFK
jgi:hypothetical protein